uniref:Uncharacterized protein n=1 Tax=Knipowitschia caucasica TaxID=637954 RepID=A0AAV2LTH6_KNICA
MLDTQTRLASVVTSPCLKVSVKFKFSHVWVSVSSLGAGTLSWQQSGRPNYVLLKSLCERRVPLQTGEFWGLQQLCAETPSSRSPHRHSDPGNCDITHSSSTHSCPHAPPCRTFLLPSPTLQSVGCFIYILVQIIEYRL